MVLLLAIGLNRKSVKQLDISLDVISRLYSRRFLTATLKEMSKPFQKAAKRNAPKLTGMLAKGVKPRIRKRLRTMVIVKVGPSKKEFWGMFQEFGTAHHAAQPWMAPAWDTTKHETLAGMVDALAKVLNRTAKRLERKALANKRLTRADVNLLFGT